jgi:hypothetical protein
VTGAGCHRLIVLPRTDATYGLEMQPQDNTFRNSEALRRFTTLDGAMKHKALPLLFVLLSTVSFFGRTGSDQDTAHALKGILLLRNSMRDPDSLQVSHALITNKGVCIEYFSRSKSGGMSTGFAVYKADKDLVWIDNSWVWGQACLFGKYAQRRDGKDVTEEVDAVLKRQQSPAIASQQRSTGSQPMAAAEAATTRAIQPAPPGPPVGTPVLTARATEVVPTPIAVAPAAQVVAPAPPVEVRTPAEVTPPTAVTPVPATSESGPRVIMETGLTFPVRPELKKSLDAIAAKEARSVAQVCEVILQSGVAAYQKEGTKYLHRLIASQKPKGE